MNTDVTADQDAIVPADIAATIVDPSAYANDRIYEAYRWLRANNRVGRVEHPDYDPFWLVTRYEDIREVEQDSYLFRNGDRPFQLLDRKAVQHMRKANEGRPSPVTSLVAMDAPDHMRHRSIAQAWFMPKNLKAREADIRLIARRAIEALENGGEHCDFVRDLALRYPLRVIMSIFGVPESDEPLMLKLTQELFGTTEPDFSQQAVVSGEQQALYIQDNVANFAAYFKQLSDDRRRTPRDDLATVIANAAVDGKPIGEQEELGYYIAIATAGHDTTSSSAATAIWELAANPAELEKVQADPTLVPALVDEAIRWAAPVKHFMRSASRDTELAGRRIGRGDWLMLCYGSANRDDSVIPGADLFSVERPPKPHLSFGYGAHMCLGMHLAKMEMRVLFEELLPRIRSLSLDGVPARSRNLIVNGPKTVPLRIKFNRPLSAPMAQI